MEDYKIRLSAKTKTINFVRRIFKIRFLESFLVSKVRGKKVNSFYGKLVPSNYLYSSQSIRIVERDGINYKLDISDLVDHYLYFGYYEKGTNKLYELVKPGMTVLDIGANIGSTALGFSKIVGNEGTIIAFEPDKINYQKASHNILLNNASSIKLMNIGLGNENKAYKLYAVNDENRGMNRILEHSSTHPYAEITVRRLDEVIAEAGIKKVDLVKIDVEGFEMNVLHGAVSILKTYKPVLFIELDDNNLIEQQSSASQLIAFLYSLNYIVYSAETNALLKADMNFTNCHYDIYAFQK
jgi:FkbM family methyltransferase